MTVLNSNTSTTEFIMNGDIEGFDDPEGYSDNITDEELIGDLLAKRPTENDTSEAIIIVDNIPIVGASDKLPRLKQVLEKRFGVVGKIVSSHYPLDESDQTKGYCFFEYESKEFAANAAVVLDNYPLDKAHRLAVNLFADLDKYRMVQEKWEKPKVKPYKDHGNLRSWLLDKGCRDQFLVQYENGERVAIYLNNPPQREPITLVEKHRWTESACRWSPCGTYVGTFHNQGVALWGGEGFEQIVKFPHPEVSHMDFSPCERYLVTYAEPRRYGETADALRIWDIFTGDMKRGFPLSTRATMWPYFRWSFDGKYFAALRDEAISVYDSATFKILDKKFAKLDRVKDFAWSPSKSHIMAYYQAEQDASPAVVGLVDVEEHILNVPLVERVSRTKNIFSVSDARIYWQKSGNYVCVKVDRYSKKKWDDKENEFKYSGVNQNLEIFFVNEKGIPNSFVEVTDGFRDFAWEPSGPRFCLLHGDMKYLGSFYSVRDSNITLLKTFEGKGTLNKILWAPAGGYCVLAGLKIATTGTLMFCDCSGNSVTLMNTQEHTGVTSAAWDPTGRYLASSVSIWEHGKGDYGYIMWNFQGVVKGKHQVQQFCYLAWRPRPPCSLSDEKLKEIKKNMKHYIRIFEERDRQMLSKASKEILEKRRSQVEEFHAWREDRRRTYDADAAERAELRDGVDTDNVQETDFAEEKFEVLIEEKQEIISEAAE